MHPNCFLDTSSKWNAWYVQHLGWLALPSIFTVLYGSQRQVLNVFINCFANHWRHPERKEFDFDLFVDDRVTTSLVGLSSIIMFAYQRISKFHFQGFKQMTGILRMLHFCRRVHCVLYYVSLNPDCENWQNFLHKLKHRDDVCICKVPYEQTLGGGQVTVCKPRVSRSVICLWPAASCLALANCSALSRRRVHARWNSGERVDVVR